MVILSLETTSSDFLCSLDSVKPRSHHWILARPPLASCEGCLQPAAPGKTRFPKPPHLQNAKRNIQDIGLQRTLKTYVINRISLLVQKTDIKTPWPLSLALDTFYLHFNAIWLCIQVKCRFPEVLSHSLPLCQLLFCILNLRRYSQKSEPWLVLFNKSDVSIKENTLKKTPPQMSPYGLDHSFVLFWSQFLCASYNQFQVNLLLILREKMPNTHVTSDLQMLSKSTIILRFYEIT